MNLNNLIKPEIALARLKAAALERNVWGTKRVTKDDELSGGMLSFEFSRSRGVSAALDVHVSGDRHAVQEPFRRHDPTVHALVYDLEMRVSMSMMSCGPSIAIAQATLHREVAELACTLEAMASEWTVGVPCDADGRVDATVEKQNGS